MRTVRLLPLVLILLASCAAAQGDRYVITLDPAARVEPATGRLLLFFLTEGSPDWGASPVDGPFFDRPEPIAGVDVTDWRPGTSITIDGAAMAFPHSIDHLHGSIRVQAILDIDRTERSFQHGPGNMFSDVISARVDRSRPDEVKLTLSHVVKPRELPAEQGNLKWVQVRSERLSAFYGRDVYHRAGVALPRGWFDPAQPEKKWPAIYIVPGFGGREESAANYAEMLATVEPEYAPQAVIIVLDPESPLGHHGFVDNDNHGPRGSTLVEEFIPELEKRFRLDARPDRRLLYGHSSGGWTVLWLQLNWPAFFGGCWSSAPDPVDFAAFQMTNLYTDGNLFTIATGADATARNDTPSYRTVDFEGRDVVHMTVRQEAGMERIIAPDGTSGLQWDAWEAMFSPRDPATGLPRPMFDALTGVIDKQVVEHWSRFDIALRLRDNWETLGPVMRQKVRLFCGEHDSFYLDRAVRRVKEMVDLRSPDLPPGPGYVEIVRFASHGSLVNLTAERVHKEMIEQLKRTE